MSNIVIKEVTTKGLMKKFVKFPLKLYKNNPYYVPIFTADELNMLKPHKNPTLKDCDAHYYIAEIDKKVVGRIGLIQHFKYNERTGKKSLRFTRFDAIDSSEVAQKLLGTVEEYAKNNGLDIIYGPYGFNETDRSGILTEGFDRIANIGTNFNYPYYEKLLNDCGYASDNTWLELEVLPSEAVVNRLKKLSDYVIARKGFRIAKEKTFKEFAQKYGWKAFECLNNAYIDLPGFIPFEKDLYEQIAAQFGMIINTRYMCAVLNQQDDVIGFAVCFPSIGDAVRRSRGSILPFGIFRMLRAIKTTKELELCLIGVKKEYQMSGVNVVMIHYILQNLMEDGITRTEAYPQLIENEKALSQWKMFDATVTKKRKVFEKNLTY